MDHLHGHTSLNRGDLILDQLTENGKRFKNTMESIFQKYSSLDDTGPDVCFKTMTFRTAKGAVPLDSVEADREMHRLRLHVRAEQSPHDKSVVLDSANNPLDLSEEMDIMQKTENALNLSSQMKTSLCDDAKISQLSLSLMSGPHDCTWMEPAQPEEEDQDLERTLSSHGSTLLDVYPGMLDQIGKAYRRQQVTDAASTVLRRYRRQRRKLSVAQGRGHGDAYNRTLSKDNLFAARKGLCSNRNSHPKNRSSTQAGLPRRSKLEVSPYTRIINLPSASSDCFYSPRRDGAEESVGTGSRHRPVHMPSQPSSSPRSPSLDLNQTFDIEQDSVPGPRGFLTTAIYSPTRSKYNSPQKEAKSPLLIGRGGRPEFSSTSRHSHSGPEQRCTNSFLTREHLRNSYSSSATSLQRAVIGRSLSDGRSPLRPTALSLEQEQLTSSSVSYPKQPSALNYRDMTVVYRSPRRSQHELLSSPLSKYRQNLDVAQLHQVNPRPPKRQRSLSGHQTLSPSVTHMSRRQIDSEFRRIYHHFICRGSSSSSHPASFCHLCDRRLDDDVRGRPFSSSSLSALALTPPWSRVKKRRRQPEVEDSLRLKRFRESCSPLSRNKPLWLQQPQENSPISTTMEEPNENKRTWNRALLLQCPSPGFLMAHESIRRVPGSKLGLPIHQQSPSWRDASNYIGAVEAKSPLRTWNQSGFSLSPSTSRRRLLYGPLQG